MARHLTLRDVDAIVNLIHGWSETKMTWDEVCEASKPLVGKKPTRQSLNAHEAIVTAYKGVKQRLRETCPKNPRPGSLKTAADRIARLQSEVDALKRKNNALLEQFVVWQYNAYKHGMKEHQLNAPLPQIDRERTENN